jgi:hypothetical protein
MLLDPHWLERSYSQVFVPDPDCGSLRRTLFVDRFLRRLRFAGIVPRHGRSLDYGSGMGMLVRLQRDRDVDAWGYDLYATPKFAEQYCSKQVPDGTFDLITSIEVIEHTLNPIEMLQALRAKLSDRGVMVVSTELVDGQPNVETWHYLAKEHGQHITLFSRAGLAAAADSAGFDWVRSFPLDGVPFLHLMVPTGQSPSMLRRAVLAVRQVVG